MLDESHSLQQEIEAALRDGALVLCARVGSGDERQLQRAFGRAASSSRRAASTRARSRPLICSRLTLKDVRYRARDTVGRDESAPRYLSAIGRMRARFCMCTPSGTRCSQAFVSPGTCSSEGYEILKGLSGVTTHEHRERVPIIENTQDYAMLANAFEKYFATIPSARGFAEPAWALYLGTIGGRSAPSPGGTRVSVRGGGTAAHRPACLRAVGLSSHGARLSPARF